MTLVSWRLPAEWEPQDAVLLAFPHPGTDWAPWLADVEQAYVALIAAILPQAEVLLCVNDAATEARASHLLTEAGVTAAGLRVLPIAYDDTWCRDIGPITLSSSAGFRLLDFRFTGWGGKFRDQQDDRLVQRLHDSGLFAAEYQRLDFALEGGAIESDGAGTVLTTWRCLAQRHPGASRAALAQRLTDTVGAERVLGLEHGELEGDDTDAHIDTLARFASVRDIVYQACDDAADPHHAGLAAMAEELAALRDAEGRPYRLHALPWAAAIVAADGRRLAASYANFLIVNGAVLMPAYGDPADERAAEMLAAAFPGYRIVPVPCRIFIEQNGSLHCLTMQLPQGVLQS